MEPQVDPTVTTFKIKSYAFVSELIGAVEMRRVNILLATKKEHLLPIANPFPMPYNFKNEIDVEKESIRMDKAEGELNSIKEAIHNVSQSPNDIGVFSLAKESIERRINTILKMFGCNKVAAF